MASTFLIVGLNCDGKHAVGYRGCCKCNFSWIQWLHQDKC